MVGSALRGKEAIVRRIGVLLLPLCLVLAEASSALTLVASDGNGALYDIDRNTAEASNARSGERIVGLIGISTGPDGFLYGLSTFGGPTPNSLFRIDPVTGTSQLVGATGLTDIFEGDLDFDPVSGTLYTISNAPNAPFSELAAVDYETGVATVIGELPTIGDYSAMAFAPDGTLYALDTSNEELVTVDLVTADILQRIDLSFSGSSTAGMDFDPVTGELFMVATNDRLSRIDLATGDVEVIGGPAGTPFGMWGLEFVVPEPATGTLLGLGLVGLAASRRTSAPSRVSSGARGHRSRAAARA